MKSPRLAALVLLLQCAATAAFSQDNFLKDYAPVAPTAASLGKYGDIPVSYHTGLPNINIPIHTFTEGSLSVPISLSYHASGIRVQETSSWVGLGWALNAGGIITRTVQGAPDERGNNGQDWGWYANKGNGLYGMCVGTGEAANGHVDTEPDIFNFNVGGYSGKFYYDADTVLRIIPQQDLVIKTINGNGSTFFSGWIMIAPDGTKYHFGATTAGMAYSDYVEKNTYTNDPFTATKPSSWYLSKIESADGKDVINFSYADEKYSFWDVSNKTADLGLIYAGQSCPGSFSSVWAKEPIWAKIDGKRLSGITGTNGSVIFVPETSPRTDLNGYFYSAANGIPANTEAKALNSIEVRSKNSSCLHKFSLAYTYWTSTSAGDPPAAYLPYGLTSFLTDKQRLVLTSLTESDCSSTTNNKVHSFDYFNPGQLPRRLSFAQDHYGYYNGSNSNTDLNPGTPWRKSACGDCDYGLGSYMCLNPSKRAPHWPEMEYGTLSKITYPTGGSTAFEFEGHKIWGADTTCIQTSLATTSASQWGGPNSVTIGPFTALQLSQNSVIAYVQAQCLGTTASSVSTMLNNGVPLGASAPVGCSSNVTAYRQLSLQANTTYTFTLTASSGAGFLGVYTLQRIPVPMDVLSGGLRIKKITTSDGDGDATNDMVKNFDYQVSGGSMSSGKLVHKPLYTGIYLTLQCPGLNPPPAGTPPPCDTFYIGYNSPCYTKNLIWVNNPYSGCPPSNGSNPQMHLVASSGGLQPMQTTMGSIIGYTQVKVTETAVGATLYNYNMGQYYSAPYAPSRYPFVPPPFEPMLGTLSSVSIFDNSGQLLKSTDYQYTWAKTMTDLGTSDSKWPMKAYLGGGVAMNKYTLNSGYNLPSQETERTYNPDLTYQQRITKHFYNIANGHLQQAAEVVTNSDGTYYRTQYKYALDYPCPSGTNCNETASTNSEAKAIFAMRKRNMVSIPIEQTTWLKKSGWASGKLTGATYFKFDKAASTYDNIKLQEVYQVRTATPIDSASFAFTSASASSFAKDSRYTREYNFQFSDAFGRLMTQWKENDPAKQQYLWGHNQKLPIAKVINADANGIAFTSFEEPNTTLSTQGNWSVPASGQTTTSGDFQTGRAGYNLTQRTITASNIPGGSGWGNYIVSFWAKNGTVTVSGLSLAASQTATASGWTYFEKAIKQNATAAVNITGTTGTIIDELRLHQADAQMRTFSYDDNNQNLLSITDENGVSAHFDYDSWQRLAAVRDQDRNILQTYEYNYQQAGTALNDVKSRTVLTGGQTTLAMVNTLAGANVKKIVQYIDGLGRPVETNAVGQSPTSLDIISFNKYDVNGREPKSYIPYTATSNGGSFVSIASAVTAQNSFANNFGAGNYGWSETVFEASPLARPLEQGAPGATWRTGQGASAHTMRHTWRTNTAADNVRDFANNGFFAANALWVSQDQGENGNLRWTFSDKLGRIVLVRQELNATETAQTYTVYDDFDRVAYVVPLMMVPIR